ncbi:MAG: 4-vinyl reductase [Nitrososphaerota archaeon]|nr:4-vinyl reductase [Nitrososphaerota archaeon]MDG6960354.1 4-vinyl reductase [Nitrososphaerota archaeon]MDG6972520.1 4-vinyl reductase [Nitrososphaerota archaeon]MDG6980731.1 4-vinyl reductase [Nitrososphaerota archaeon]
MEQERSSHPLAEGAREAKRPGKLVTGHQILDKILTVYQGNSILMLDETYSEARNFMQLIIEKYNPGLKFVEITDRISLANRENLEVLTGDTLADKVVRVNAIRRKHAGEILVHSYLPSLLISQPQDNVLKYVDGWKNAAKEFETVEIFLMPSNSFKETERKLIALLDCRVEFSVTRKDSRMAKYFVISGCCRAEFNMKEFEYLVEGDKLLVEWEGSLTDRPAQISEGALEKKYGEIVEKPATFIIQKGANSERAALTVSDYTLIHQIIGMSAGEVSALFPERPKEILQRLAKWDLAGVVSFKRDFSRSAGPIPESKDAGYSVLNALRLLLPDRLVAWSYKMGTQAVPLEYFVANREALSTVIDMLTENAANKDKNDYLKSMPQIERSVLEMAARRAALLEVPRHHESTAAAAARKYIPKIMRVSLLSAFILRSKIDKISDTEYHIVVHNCYICGNQTTKVPMCSSVSGGLEGVCGTVFKLKADCTEVRCKALGDRNCEFRLRLYS